MKAVRSQVMRKKNFLTSTSVRQSLGRPGQYQASCHLQSTRKEARVLGLGEVPTLRRGLC